MQFSKIPTGTIVHNVEIKPEKGAQIARSAGSFAQILEKDSEYVNYDLDLVKLEKFMSLVEQQLGQFQTLIIKMKSMVKLVEWFGKV